MQKPQFSARLSSYYGICMTCACLLAALCCTAVLSDAAAAASTDPLVGFHYALEVEGIITGYFTEVSGIGSENEIIEHKVVDGSGKESVQKIPGRLKWSDVTLKRGITANLDAWNWRKMVVDGNVAGARKNFCIIMYDAAMSEIARWNFVNGWPAMIDAPYNGIETTLAVETLVIVHEGCSREGTSPAATTTIPPDTTTTVEPVTTTTTIVEPATTTTTTEGETAVELEYFVARAGNGRITLSWKTGSEIDNAGFNIYRATAEDGEYVKINAALIPAKGSATEGASYSFTDDNVQNRKTYIYKLEDIDLHGTATMHGPVSATPRLILKLFR